MGYNHYPYARKVGSSIEFKNPAWNFPKMIHSATNFDIHQPAAGATRLMEDATQYLALYRDGVDNIIRGYIGNNDLYLMPSGSGVVKFGTYAAIVAETLQGYVLVKDAAGNSRKLAVIA